MDRGRRHTIGMRREVTQWLRTARADRAAADVLQGAGRYSHAVFLAHQSAEKSLKAAVLARTREYPPMTHNLRILAECTGTPPPEAVGHAMLRAWDPTTPPRATRMWRRANRNYNTTR